MSEYTLIFMIIIFIGILIFIIHLYDRHLVNQINSYEKKLQKKGIFKRHFIKK